MRLVGDKLLYRRKRADITRGIYTPSRNFASSFHGRPVEEAFVA